MARLIDADAKIKIQVYDDEHEEYITKEMAVEEALDAYTEDGCPTTIDAEPVIKCKDCHYAKPYNKIWQLPKRDTLVCTHFANDEVDNNFFCGYAIKKMDGEIT